MSIHLIASARTIDTLKPHVRRLNDGCGLHIRQTANKQNKKKKYWYQDYTFQGKRTSIALGSYPEVGLKEARQRSLDIRTQVGQGIDPAAARRESRQAHDDPNHPRSVRSIATQWFASQSVGWSADYAKTTDCRLNAHVHPALGHRLIDTVETKEITQLIATICASGTVDTAGRVLSICRRVFDYALSVGHITANPCALVKEVIPEVPTKHRAALTTPFELADLLQRLRSFRGTFVVQCALELTMSTFLRSAELRGAQWSEINLDQQLWVVPAKRMKGKKERKLNGAAHYVPLSRQAVATLRKLKAITGHTGYVFAGQGRKNPVISGNTINNALRSTGISTCEEQSAHGFRATARTMAVEQLHFDDRLVDLQLDHVVKDSNGRAYNRTRMLKQRAVMMQRWADYLDWLRELPASALGPFTSVDVPAAVRAPAGCHCAEHNPIHPGEPPASSHVEAMAH